MPVRLLALILLLVSPVAAQVKTSHFPARDTLDIAPDADPKAQAVLDGLVWQPAAFDVRAESLVSGERDAVVWFPSPRPQSGADQDRVALEWYAARDDSGQVIEAPAMLVVHSLHPAMPYATAVAGELSRRGVHVFVVHLPGYGLRSGGQPISVLNALVHPQQSVTDVRRARDAIAALPNVRPGPVGIVGISLGGFAAATAASLDGAFDPVVLVLSGVDGYGVVQNGQHDAATVRRILARHGYAGPRLKRVLDQADPQHLIHRLDPDRTWLYSARDDHVIPRACVDALTDRLPLDDSHHIWMAGTHYTAIIALPAVINQLETLINPPMNTAAH